MTLPWPLASSAGLSELDLAFARLLARQFPQTPRLALAGAALASAAVQQGHACLPLSAIMDANSPLSAGAAALGMDNVQPLHEALTAAPFVGTHFDAAAPLILDDECLYLRRYLRYEMDIAGRVRQRAARIHPNVDRAWLRARLSQLFPGLADAGSDHGQAVAAALSLRHGLTVLCGGPGTGKTYTAVRILALLREHAGGQDLRIGLAAPTGKAAGRLMQSMREGLREIDDDGRLAGSLPVATTLHRLLGFLPHRVTPRFNADAPLALDVLIVDECSMIDLPLFAKLLQALPDSARLILLGDPGQLPAVEGGAVFATVAAANGDGRYGGDCAEYVRETTGANLPTATSPSKLADTVVRLQRTRRFVDTSAIARLVRAVGAGDRDAVLGALRSGQADLQWQDSAFDGSGAAELALLRGGYATLTAARTPADALDALDGFRVLCALRDGPIGASGLNALIERQLYSSRVAATYYRGRPLIVSSNDYALGLFNGDVGVVFDGTDTGTDALRAWFAQADGLLRSLSPAQLPAHESAYAMTAHRAQGSEFDRVVLVLPREPHPLITREWLYTAASRARTQLHVIGPWAVIEDALARRDARYSGLANRLRDA